MVKTHETVKTFSSKATKALTGLLKQIPNIEIANVQQEERTHRKQELDCIVDVVFGEKRFHILVEMKQMGEPRYIRNAIAQVRNVIFHHHDKRPSIFNGDLVPLIISTYLSPQAQAICKQEAISYLDLFGNAHIKFDGIFIDHQVAEKPKTEIRSLKSLFSPKAAQVIKVLFAEPQKAWRVVDISESSGVSLGHVSNVRKQLVDREWVSEEEGGIVLSEPAEVLNSWRESYQDPSIKLVRTYSHLSQDELTKRVAQSLTVSEQEHPGLILSHNSAAQWIAPFVRDGLVTFYSKIDNYEQVKSQLNLTEVHKGANVIFRIVDSDLVFIDAIEPVPGTYCTSPIQTYLDLWIGNERNHEAAEFLRKEELVWVDQNHN